MHHDLATPFEEDIFGGPWVPTDYHGSSSVPQQAAIVVFSETDFPHNIPSKTDAGVANRILKADTAMAHLSNIAAGIFPPQFLADPAGFLQSALDSLPDTNSFAAGGWSRAFPVWEHLLGPFKRAWKGVNWALKAMSKGANWPMVPPVSQVNMPKHALKLSRARRALSLFHTPQQVDALLRSDKPAPLHLPNHKSALLHADFVEQELEKLQQTGALMQLPQGQVPTFVCSLGAVVQRDKVRLVLDPLMLNLLLKYSPVKYEQITDICTYASADQWACTTDEKSGYHHLALHPSLWTYLGVQWEGKHYVFTHLPFGLGPACWAYTLIKQLVYRLIREKGGVLLTAFIDDQLNVAPDRLTATFQHAVIIMLKEALGFYLSIPKLQGPLQIVDFLGLILDLPNLRFLLPAHKIAEFRALVAALVAGQAVGSTRRQLAVLAGKLSSFSPAIGLAPLYAQVLYKVSKGLLGWDTLFLTSADTLVSMQWVANHLDEWNGRSWVCNRPVVLVAGDYSSVGGYAAFFPNAEFGRVEVSLSPCEQESIASNRLSSTYGELRVVDLLLQTILLADPLVLQGKTLHYQSDNQATVWVLSTMSGNDTNFPLVRKIWEQAKAADVHIVITWHPRESQLQVHADMLSKLADNSSWALNQHVFDNIASHPIVAEKGGFTVDIFADNLNCKVRSAGIPQFYSRAWCPGSRGVDCFLFPWHTNPSTGSQEFCFINGDFSQIGRIIAKVKAERVTCALVYPHWPRYWSCSSMWLGVPVQDTLTLPRIPTLCIPGSRVDSGKRRGHPPSYLIKVAIIVW